MEEADIAREQLEENARRFLVFTGVTKPPPTAVFILVMGMTGAGKSSFIAACTGKPVTVGHDLQSCTSDIALFDFDLDGRQVYLIDTPGFDDTDRSDKDTLHAVATYLATSYAQNVYIHGIIYAHRINNNRVSGSSKRNIDMFRALCGETTYSNVAIATTMWPTSVSSSCDHQTFSQREAELSQNPDFFGAMLSGGARMFRHAAAGQSQRSSARAIVRHLIRRSRLSPVVLLIQHELIDKKIHLDETSAGIIVAGDLGRLIRERDRELTDLKRELKALGDRNSAHRAEMTLDHARVQQELHDTRQRQLAMIASISEMQRRQQEITRAQVEAMNARFCADLHRSRSELRLVKESLRLMQEEARSKAGAGMSSPQERHEVRQELVEFEAKVESVTKRVEQKEAAVKRFAGTKAKLVESLTSGTMAGVVSGLAGGGASAIAGSLLCLVQ